MKNLRMAWILIIAAVPAGAQSPAPAPAAPPPAATPTPSAQHTAPFPQASSGTPGTTMPGATTPGPAMPGSTAPVPATAMPGPPAQSAAMPGSPAPGSAAPGSPMPGAGAPGAPRPGSAMAGAAPAAQLPPLDPHEASYLFGLGFGEQLHNVGITDQLTLKELTRGVQDGLKGKRSSQDDRRRVQAFVRAQMESSIARNQAAAKDFLARNGREKGIVTTASGLEYKVIAAGDFKAAPITHADTVTVQYRGTLLDGSEFDNSYVRGSPATFPVTGVIPGWQEALVLMKPGAKWRLFVPPDLAYGNSPKPGIPGGSLLIFDVELLSVKSGAATSTPPQPSPTPPQPSPAPPQPAPAPSH